MNITEILAALPDEGSHRSGAYRRGAAARARFIFNRRRCERRTRSRPLFAHLVRLPESSGVSRFSRAGGGNHFQSAGAFVSAESGRCDPCRSSGARGADCSDARLPGSEVGGYHAALLDALSGGVRILGGGRFTGTGRYAGFAGSIAETVCHVA